MNFDPLAPHYHWLEFLFAGQTLQRCRTAWLEAVLDCKNVLIVGEGDGRFLAECATRLPHADITCVDGSAAMLNQAQNRNPAQAQMRGAGKIKFVHGVLPEWQPPPECFDLIVTHFFLDCFSEENLAQVITSLAKAAAPQAIWLLADFQIPAKSGVARWRAQKIIDTAYLFFRITAGLQIRSLVDPGPVLMENGFRCERRSEWNWEMLYSSLWRRNAVTNGQADFGALLRNSL